MLLSVKLEYIHLKQGDLLSTHFNDTITHDERARVDAQDNFRELLQGGD